MRKARLVASVLGCALLLGACSPTGVTNDGAVVRSASSPALWHAAVAIHATYAVAHGNLVASAWLVNQSSTQLIGTTGYCDVWYRVYTGPSRSGTPIWRSEDRPGNVDGGPEGAIACPLVAYVISLSPGDSLRLPTQVFDEVQQVATDGPGRYYVSLTLYLHEPRMTLEELPAGEFVVGGS
jgi:hypothetical protein